MFYYLSAVKMKVCLGFFVCLFGGLFVVFLIKKKKKDCPVSVTNSLRKYVQMLNLTKSATKCG